MEPKTFARYVLLVVMAILSIYAFALLKSYAVAIIFSFIFAYLFSGTYDRIQLVVKKDWIAASLVILLILCCFIIPAVYLVSSVVQEAQSFMGSLSYRASGDKMADFSFFLKENFNIELSNDNAANIMQLVSSRLFPSIERMLPSILSALSNFGVQAFIALFILFYLLMNKEQVLKKALKYLPFSDKNSKFFVEETGRNTRALFIGQGLIALIQGAAGALGFFIFGVPGVLMWGAVMAIGSFIPFLGTALVWIPVGVVLILDQNYFAGFGVLAWGFIVVSNIDNLVRPKLVSWLGDIHPVVVLLGVFIGIKEFNILGIIIGPLLLSTLLILYKLFIEEYVVA